MRHKSAGQTADHHSPAGTLGGDEIYTIFEGTSEIQRLVIARAISGMRIR
jgi:acyl-CoA dehydrogenase